MAAALQQRSRHPPASSSSRAPKGRGIGLRGERRVLRYVDHAIIAVADLDAAARDYEQLLGFAVSAGGAHPGAGTQNRLIVLDPAYIELIARLPGASLGEPSPVTPMFARAPGPGAGVRA